MIRFGIAGFGLHAVRRLMPGFALAEDCQVVALSRRNRQKAEENAREYGIQHVFSSTEELCECPDVDAVFVTTPNACHLPDVLVAARAHKPVLCEKPMGMNADQCRQMIDAARQAGVLLGVAQVFRFEASTAKLKQFIGAGEIGYPLFARAEFSYPGLGHPRIWLNDRSIAGGGPIADVSVHCIDALRFILNDEPEKIMAIGRSDSGSGDVEAAAILTLEFSRGTLATVLVSTRANYRTPLEFVGDKGTLRADNGLTVDRPITIELWREQKIVKSETVSNHLAYTCQVDAFAAAVETNEPFLVPGEEGWRNQLVLDAAYSSLQTGKAETIAIPRGGPVQGK